MHSTLAIYRHKKESRHGEQTLTDYGKYMYLAAMKIKKTASIWLRKFKNKPQRLMGSTMIHVHAHLRMRPDVNFL